MLKNSFELFSAPCSGAENAVFVVFWPCSNLFWTADRADNDFFNSLGSSRKLRELEEEKIAGVSNSPGSFYASELPKLVAGSKR